MSKNLNSRGGRPRRQLAQDQLQDLRREGLSFREIARRTGLGYGSVRRAISTANRPLANQHSTSESSADSGGQI